MRQDQKDNGCAEEKSEIKKLSEVASTISKLAKESPTKAVDLEQGEIMIK